MPKHEHYEELCALAATGQAAEEGQLAAPQVCGAEGWLLPGETRHCAVATRQKSTARRLVSIDRGGRAVPIEEGADIQTSTTPMLCAAGLTVTILPFPI